MTTSIIKPGQVFVHLNAAQYNKKVPPYAERRLVILGPTAAKKTKFRALATWSDSELLPSVTVLSRTTLLNGNYKLLSTELALA